MGCAVLLSTDTVSLTQPRSWGHGIRYEQPCGQCGNEAWCLEQENLPLTNENVRSFWRDAYRYCR